MDSLAIGGCIPGNQDGTRLVCFSKYIAIYSCILYIFLSLFIVKCYTMNNYFLLYCRCVVDVLVVVG